jgi:hypothetical protein
MRRTFESTDAHARWIGKGLLALLLLALVAVAFAGPLSVRLRIRDQEASLLRLQRLVESDPSPQSRTVGLEALLRQRAGVQAQKRREAEELLIVASRSLASLGALVAGIIGAVALGRSLPQRALPEAVVLAGGRARLLRGRLAVAFIVLVAGQLLAAGTVWAAFRLVEGRSGPFGLSQASALGTAMAVQSSWLMVGFGVTALARSLALGFFLLWALWLVMASLPTGLSLWNSGALLVASGSQIWPPDGFLLGGSARPSLARASAAAVVGLYAVTAGLVGMISVLRRDL